MSKSHYTTWVANEQPSSAAKRK